VPQQETEMAGLWRKNGSLTSYHPAISLPIAAVSLIKYIALFKEACLKSGIP
jgi:hypothetical protein